MMVRRILGLVLGLLIVGLFGPMVAAAETRVAQEPGLFRFDVEQAAGSHRGPGVEGRGSDTGGWVLGIGGWGATTGSATAVSAFWSAAGRRVSGGAGARGIVGVAASSRWLDTGGAKVRVPAWRCVAGTALDRVL